MRDMVGDYRNQLGVAARARSHLISFDMSIFGKTDRVRALRVRGS
jgi:hypothetical protein